ncbi:MAG: hypothetical protein V1689_01100 [Pseudomonadota bacterium]
MRSHNRLISWVKALMAAGGLLGLLFTLSCGDSGGSGPSGKSFTIGFPSETERYLGEKRDFYVIGFFDKGVQRPGDVRIALFRGETASGTPVRSIESHVDQQTGVTPMSAIEQNYPEGVSKGLDVAPDLVNDPGGFYNPNNKVLVTQSYFGGIILGGATKDFDTDYLDPFGNPLEDLTEGVYTLKVTGLSGEVAGYTQTMTLYFKPVTKLFGAFLPDNHEKKFIEYARGQGYRIFLDPFAGYFFPEGFSAGSYKIDKRWRPQNSLEVVNTLSGVSYGTPDNAMIGFVLYNLVVDGVTSCLEIGKALLTGVIDSPNTFFCHYDIGEPEITYTPMDSGEKVTLEGFIRQFDPGDRLVLTRAAIRMMGTGDGDNRYNLYDDTPTALDLDLADGIVLMTAQEFSIFGVVTPIPTTVTPSPDRYLYYIADNRITQVRYHIRNAQGQEILTTTREVNLGRVYIQSEPTRLFYSIFEFEHEFDLNVEPGRYSVELVAIDERGNEISGTEEVFTVDYQ